MVTRPLYLRFRRADADGNPLDWVTRPVEDATPEGERRPVRITILALEDVELPELGTAHAKACGFRSALAMRTAWLEERPRSTLVRLVHFAMGDVLDRDRYLNKTGSAGGDYTGNWRKAIDDLPALDEQQLAELASKAKQRDTGRKVAQERQLASESLAERVGRLERAGLLMRSEIRQELRIITERTERGERKVGREKDLG